MLTFGVYCDGKCYLYMAYIRILWDCDGTSNTKVDSCLLLFNDADYSVVQVHQRRRMQFLSPTGSQTWQWKIHKLCWSVPFCSIKTYQMISNVSFLVVDFELPCFIPGGCQRTTRKSQNFPNDSYVFYCNCAFFFGTETEPEIA